MRPAVSAFHELLPGLSHWHGVDGHMVWSHLQINELNMKVNVWQVDSETKLYCKGTDDFFFFLVSAILQQILIIAINCYQQSDPDFILCTKTEIVLFFQSDKTIKTLTLCAFWPSKSTLIRQLMSFCSYSGYSHDQFSGLMAAGVAGVSWLAA